MPSRGDEECWANTAPLANSPSLSLHGDGCSATCDRVTWRSYYFNLTKSAACSLHLSLSASASAYPDWSWAYAARLHPRRLHRLQRYAACQLQGHQSARGRSNVVIRHGRIASGKRGPALQCVHEPALGRTGLQCFPVVGLDSPHRHAASVLVGIARPREPCKQRHPQSRRHSHHSDQRRCLYRREGRAMARRCRARGLEKPPTRPSRLGAAASPKRWRRRPRRLRPPPLSSRSIRSRRCPGPERLGGSTRPSPSALDPRSHPGTHPERRET